ncbi:ran-interacting mog1 [Lecanosticta acicola]|uniref:Ran-interacting mog1 n=1 Tax=Lecanosticta acicola TaxID=111012 RepID=A0AAI9E9Z8_9PEZI|nr:ran-interacting mog1 [Lecanosticta acicola]
MATQQQFKPASLFGGAIVVDLPATFEDVSEIRQVPDNQEVYLDRAGFSSIVVDILERVTDKPNDIEALKFHLSDIVDEDAGQTKIFNIEEEVTMRKMPPGTKVLTLIAISPPGEKMRGRANEPDFVGILLVLVRLVEKETDVVVSVNVPHMPGEYVREDVDLGKGRCGRLLEVGKAVRERVLETFEVKNWDLFV